MPDNSAITPAQMKRLQTLMGKLANKDGVPKPAQRPWRLIWVGRRVRPENPYLYSFKELTKAEAAAALELLAKELPGQPRSRRRSGSGTRRGNSAGSSLEIVSAGTLELLGRMKVQLGWNDQRFEAFARRQLRGRAMIRTEGDAKKIWGGMKSLLRQASQFTPQAPLTGDLGGPSTSEANGASPIKQTPTSDPAAESSAGAELSACSGCSGLVDGDPHGRDKGEPEDSDFAPSLEEGKPEEEIRA